MSGDRHRRNPVAFRPSPEQWAAIDRKAAAAGRPADQVARQIVKDALERGLARTESGELEHEERVNAVLDRISGLKPEECQRLLGWLSSAVPDEVDAAVTGVIGLR